MDPRTELRDKILMFMLAAGGTATSSEITTKFRDRQPRLRAIMSLSNSGYLKSRLERDWNAQVAGRPPIRYALTQRGRSRAKKLAKG